MERNDLFNLNCQKFMEKYELFKDHKNPVINGLCNLIYLHTYINLPRDMQNKMKQPSNNINEQAQDIYSNKFPNYKFDLIINELMN